MTQAMCHICMLVVLPRNQGNSCELYKHVYRDFIKDEREKSQYKDTILVKQRKDMVTDL